MKALTWRSFKMALAAVSLKLLASWFLFCWKYSFIKWSLSKQEVSIARHERMKMTTTSLYTCLLIWSSTWSINDTIFLSATWNFLLLEEFPTERPNKLELVQRKVEIRTREDDPLKKDLACSFFYSDKHANLSFMNRANIISFPCYQE